MLSDILNSFTFHHTALVGSGQMFTFARDIDDPALHESPAALQVRFWITKG
jgi:hypothetical protein